MSKPLPNKRRRKPTGKVVKLSRELYDLLMRKCSPRGSERPMSLDAMLRKHFGVQSRKGEPSPMLEGWIEVGSEKFYLDKRDAMGAACIDAAKRKVKNVTRPIKVREVL